jgi:resuscitation-promoting factor RpfB
MDGSVGQLLADQGIAVDAADEVIPSPSTALADGMTVTVSTKATDAGRGAGVWVVEGAGRPAIIGVAAELAGSPSSGSASVGQPPMRAVRVVVKGKEHDVLTDAQTVGDLLSAMGITPDGDDRVLPPPSSPLAGVRTVRFVNVRSMTRTVQRTLAFDTEDIASTSITPGSSQVVRPGQDGAAVDTYLVRIANGHVTRRTFEDRRVTTAPVTELRRVGVGATSSSSAPTNTPSPGAVGSQTGDATWYDPPWSGLTAAHRSLPFGTMVTVTNLDNGRSVTVKIDDRGPYAEGRIIDLSPEAFQVIAPLGQGVAHVRISW